MIYVVEYISLIFKTWPWVDFCEDYKDSSTRGEMKTLQETEAPISPSYFLSFFVSLFTQEVISY